MENLVVLIEGSQVLDFVGDDLPKGIEQSMVQALNKTAPWLRTRADQTIREEVNFPASYLRPSEGRLRVATKAQPGKLFATIEGRGRPTSLARFVAPGTPMPGERTRGGRARKPKGGEITVSVKPGSRSNIKRAFLISLPGSPDSRNLGLAVRTDGGPPKGAYAPKKLGRGDNLWLLYGPSVDQVLYSARNNGGVIREISPEGLAYLDAEFTRQMKRRNLYG